MIFDVYGELSDAQTLSAIGSDSSAASTDIIDLTQYNKTFGVASGNLYLNIVCNTTATSGTSVATLTIKLCRDTVAPIDGASTVIYQTPAYAVGSDQMTAYDGKKGMILCMPLPDEVDSTGATDALIGLYYTTGGGEAFTAGAIDAWIGPPMQSRYDTQVASSNV